MNRALCIADKQHMEDELNLLKMVLINNEYQLQVVECIIKQQRTGTKPRDTEEEEEVRGVAMIPFCGPIANRVTRL